MDRMRVVFDARHLHTVSRTPGLGRYSRNLLARSRAARRPTRLTLLRLRPSRRPIRRRSRRTVTATFGCAGPSSRCSPSIPSCSRSTAARRRRRLPLGPARLAALRRMAAVVTIHDLAPLHFPDEYLRTPYASATPGSTRSLGADAVIAVSRRRPRTRARPVPAPRPRRCRGGRSGVRPAAGRGGRRDAYVGLPAATCSTWAARSAKNMTALRPFAAASARDDELRPSSSERSKLTDHARGARRLALAPERVVTTGFVDDATLGLYAGAECLSTRRGSGVRPHRARVPCRGTPVVAYDAGAVARSSATPGSSIPRRLPVSPTRSPRSSATTRSRSGSRTRARASRRSRGPRGRGDPRSTAASPDDRAGHVATPRRMVPYTDLPWHAGSPYRV